MSWIPWAVSALGVVVASFMAYHKERMARLRAEEELARERGRIRARMETAPTATPPGPRTHNPAPPPSDTTL
jgi:hypothetical protein